MNNQKNKLIEQTETQRNPYAARPEDFPISEPDEIASRRTPTTVSAVIHDASTNSYSNRTLIPAEAKASICQLLLMTLDCQLQEPSK